MRQLRIGLDFDGVIADSMKIKARVANELFGQKIYWGDFKREIVVGHWLTEEEYNTVNELTYRSWQYGKLIEPVAGAKFSIAWFKNLGYDLLIVTSRSGKIFDVAEQWLEREKLNLIPIIGIGYKKNKAPILSAWSADIYIDDDLDKLLPLVGLIENLFLFSWPYNQHEILPPEIKRIENGWEEFRLEVHKIQHPQTLMII